MIKKILSCFAAVFLFCSLFVPGIFAESAPKSTVQMKPIEQSEAYQEYLQKPKGNLGKLLFGLNYFRTAPVILQYDGVEYSMAFAYPIGMAYLMTQYHDESPVKWIKKHCYRSPTANKIMYFKYPDGSFRVVRDVFIETLKTLEKVESQQPQNKK